MLQAVRSSASFAASSRDESRRHPRVVVEVPAVLSSANEDIAVVLINMGKGGVLVRPRQSNGHPDGPGVDWPPLGARSTLTFRMIGNRMCEATGQVVRHHERGFAVAFQELNRAMESFLRHLVKLPEALRKLYIIDIYHPRLALSNPA